MAEIISVQKEGTTGFNLGHLSFWRLKIDTTAKVISAPQQADSAERQPQVKIIPCFSLVMRYPPGDASSMVALVRCTIPIATSLEELQRVTSVATQGGTLDTDVLRMTEGFNLFKNHENLKGNALEKCIEDAKMILKAYWDVRLWVEDGCRQEKVIDISLENDPTKLLLRP